MTHRVIRFMQLLVGLSRASVLLAGSQLPKINPKGYSTMLELWLLDRLKQLTTNTTEAEVCPGPVFWCS